MVMVEEMGKKVPTAAGAVAVVDNIMEDVAVISTEEDKMETAGGVGPEVESSRVSSPGSFLSGLMPLYKKIVEWQ
ncbi:hypothetical protein FRB99_007572, partial [Tulasnella sp. 403]